MPSSEVSKRLNVRYPAFSEVHCCLNYDPGQRSGVSVDSPGGSEAEDVADEPVPGPSHSKWDFFKPFAGAKPSKGVASDEEVGEEDEEEEEGENSWIVEDEGPEGIPELPVAFNMSSHQDLSHHFKIICQLFVHLAVRSPSQRVSFMQDVMSGKDMNCLQRFFHMIPDVYCAWYLSVQPKMATSMLPCQRSGGS